MKAGNTMQGDYSKYNDIAETLKLIAHPVRLCIIRGLLENGECNVSHMQSCLDIPQSTVSQHLQKLRAAGIIEGRRNGLEIYYSIADERVKDIIEAIFQNEK